MKSLYMYHGTSHPQSAFNAKYCAEGNCQEGVGFYLTSDPKDAAAYGGHVLKVEVKYRKLVSTTRIANEHEILMMVKAAPDLKNTLADYDNNLMGAVNGIIKFSKNAHDAFQTVWHDFYRYEPAAYMKNMVRLGYDGVVVKRRNGVVHFIAFDPQKLIIIKKE